MISRRFHCRIPQQSLNISRSRAVFNCAASCVRTVNTCRGEVALQEKELKHALQWTNPNYLPVILPKHVSGFYSSNNRENILFLPIVLACFSFFCISFTGMTSSRVLVWWKCLCWECFLGRKMCESSWASNNEANLTFHAVRFGGVSSIFTWDTRECAWNSFLALRSTWVSFLSLRSTMWLE